MSNKPPTKEDREKGAQLAEAYKRSHIELAAAYLAYEDLIAFREAVATTLDMAGEQDLLILIKKLEELKLDANRLYTNETIHNESGRPDFASIAEAFRQEACWSAKIHSNDGTGQAASDQRALNQLADEIEAVGKRLGFT